MNQEQLSAIWPDWTLVRKLGQGSYGGVYEIQRILPGGRVERSALKQITIPRSQEEIDILLAQAVSERTITEFFRGQLQKLVQEYTMMRELGECPNIVACQDISYQPNGYGWNIYFRMELLRPLKQVVDNRYREMNVIRLGLEVCSALEACGKLNIIHRDIKPENILVSDQGVFKLGDFGIAKISEGTQTGTMAGTYGYMAPEVANRQHYGASADIYSLGMVLYWLMNNKTLPFLPLPPQIPNAPQRQQALNSRFSGEPIPAPKNGSADLKRIVLKACAFAPADRYSSVSELWADLRKLYHWKQSQTEVIMQELGLPASIIEEETMPKLKQEQSDVNVSAIQASPLEADTRRKRKGIVGAMVIGGCAALAIGIFLFGRTQKASNAANQEQISLKTTETAPLIETTQPSVTETTLLIAETTEPTLAPIFTEAKEPAHAANVECSYEANETGVTITGYSGTLPAEVVLPDTLDGMTVTKIGSDVFTANTTLKEVWLPDSITEIGEKAFSGCTKLQNVRFPDSLTRIATSAFENCGSLSSISLPEGITTIEPWAFANCKRLTMLKIPSTVTTLGEWTFSGCTGLSDIQINAGITTIENYVFFDCKRVTKVAIPEGVKTIGIGAFSGCTQLSNAVLPDSLRTLSAQAFWNTALTSINVNPNCSLGDGSVPLGCAIYTAG